MKIVIKNKKIKRTQDLSFNVRIQRVKLNMIQVLLEATMELQKEKKNESMKQLEVCCCLLMLARAELAQRERERGRSMG